MTKKWIVEYWDDGTANFIEFDSVWDQTNEELDGDCYATFYLANTAENRALIQQDLLVAVWFEDTLVFSGTLSGGDIGPSRIKAVIYDTVMLTLDEAEPISGVYDQKAASTIAGDLVAGTGITVGDCPSTSVSVVFYNANRLDCFKFLADALNLDLYSTNGTHINLAVKGDGVVWTPSSLSVSNRGLDRSKQRTKVIIRGLDCWGHHILGVAGSGIKVKTFSNNSVTDEATLNGMAAKKLAELNTDSSGAPVSVLITIGKAYAPGDSVTVVNDQYLLNGTYRIKQLNKTRTQVKLQLDRFRKSLDRAIEDLRSWEDQGIYLPGSTSWSLNLQGLVGLFHLNEGEGVAAKNKAPVDEPIDGVITACSWADGPITKMLEFNGSSSMVSLGDPSKSGINLTGKLSFGGWFSPSAADSTERNVCHKSGQFGLHYHSDTGEVTATITIGSTVHSFSSDVGIATVGARLFVMVTYDGAHVKMYVNGQLHKQWSQTGNPDSSANSVYFGVFLKGVLAEVMLWSRALVDQEVLELYFFPLFRVVGGGGGGASVLTGNADPPNVDEGQTFYKDNSNNKLTGTRNRGITKGIKVNQYLAWLFSKIVASALSVISQQTLSLEFALQSSSALRLIYQQTLSTIIEKPYLYDEFSAVGSWVISASGESLSRVTSTPTYARFSGVIKNTFSGVAVNARIGIKLTFGSAQNWGSINYINTMAYYSTLTYIFPYLNMTVTDNSGNSASLSDLSGVGNALTIGNAGQWCQISVSKAMFTKLLSGTLDWSQVKTIELWTFAGNIANNGYSAYNGIIVY